MLAAAGAVTGRLQSADALDALREVEGVVAVEVARSVQLPPPDAPIQ